MQAEEDGNLPYLPDFLAPVHPEELMQEDAHAMICNKVKEDTQEEHELEGHFPPRKGCDVCIRAYKQATGAHTGSSSTTSTDVTLGVDTLDWHSKDANGMRYTQTTVVRKTRLPVTRATAENGAAHAKNAFTKTLGWLVAVSARGPKGETYKVDRVHHDQGSEFKGEFKRALLEQGIRATDGEAEWHTDNAIAAGMQKIIHRGSCALGMHAIDDEGISNMLTSEATNWTTQLIQERQLTETQKELGISAWEEQTGTPNKLRNTKGYGKWGRLAYGYIKKSDRGGKMADKAYRGIWVGFDVDVPGAHRIVPYKENADGSVTLYRTRVTKSALMFNEIFPLRKKVRDQESVKKIELDLTWQIVGDITEESLGKVFTEDKVDVEDPLHRWEIKDIVGHSGNGPERQYKVRWVDCGEEEDTWHGEAQLKQAKKAMSKYNATPSVQRRYNDEGVACVASIEKYFENAETAESYGAAEYPEIEEYHDEEMRWSWDSMIPEANSVSLTREQAYSEDYLEQTMIAAHREMDEMAAQRMIRKQPIESCGWSKERLAKALKCQALFTKKTSTEQDVREEGKASHYIKVRLVGMDLKVRSRKHPNDVYVGVPGHSTTRLLVASTDLRECSVSTGDFWTAFLQGKHYNNGKTRDVTFWCPVSRCWCVAELTGPIYGEQIGGKNWKDTVGSDYLVGELGFVESMNQQGSYYHAERDITVVLWVDDPFIKAPLSGTNGAADAMEQLHAQMGSRFKMRNFQRLTHKKPLTYIGMRVSAAGDGSGKMYLDSAEYIQQILEEENMLECNPVKVPMSRDVLKAAAASPILVDEAEHKKLRALNGKYQWLNTTTCPWIAVGTSISKQFDAKPREGCMAMAHQILRFLKGVQYKALASQPDSDMGLILEVDSDYAGEYALTGSTHSRTAYKLTFKGMLVAWGSKKQIDVADSSGRAELNALATGIKVGMHMLHVAEELGIIPQGTRLRVYCDSNAALGFAENNGNTTKMKHIDIRMDWVRDVRDRTNTDLYRVASKDNGADFFSKIMPRAEYERTGKGLGEELPDEMRYTL